MPARASIEARAWGDVRFDVLARELGVDKYSALGRMAALWGECTERDIYYLPLAVVALYLGCSQDRVVPALCDTALLGEDTPDGIRIFGTEGKIEWLAKERARARKGGAARAKGVRSPDGKFVSVTTPTQPVASHEPAMNQPSSSHEPAQASPTATATATATENLSSASDDPYLSDQLGGGGFKRRRERCKKTQQDLLIALGCQNIRQLSKWERGLEHPPNTVIERWEWQLSKWEVERADARKAKTNGEPTSDHVAFVKWFDPYFTEFHGGRPTWDSKTGQMVKGLLSKHPLEEVKRRANIMFESVGEWPVKNIRDANLASLVRHFDLFTSTPDKDRGYSRVPTQADFAADQKKVF